MPCHLHFFSYCPIELNEMRYFCYGDNNVTCCLETMCMEEKHVLAVSGYPENCEYHILNKRQQINNKNQKTAKKETTHTAFLCVYLKKMAVWCALHFLHPAKCSLSDQPHRLTALLPVSPHALWCSLSLSPWVVPILHEHYMKTQDMYS